VVLALRPRIRSALHTALRDVDERHVMAELKKALSGGRADHPGPDDDDRGRCDGRPVEDLLHEISSGADAGTGAGWTEAVRADPGTGAR
jgi:hypothetical protein